jgi:hypothetical protein
MIHDDDDQELCSENFHTFEDICDRAHEVARLSEISQVGLHDGTLFGLMLDTFQKVALIGRKRCDTPEVVDFLQTLHGMTPGLVGLAEKLAADGRFQYSQEAIEGIREIEHWVLEALSDIKTDNDALPVSP